MKQLPVDECERLLGHCWAKYNQKALTQYPAPKWRRCEHCGQAQEWVEPVVETPPGEWRDVEVST